MVDDIYPGKIGSSPSYLTNVNGTLFFAAADRLQGKEPWILGPVQASASAASTPIAPSFVVPGSTLGFPVDPGVAGSPPVALAQPPSSAFQAPPSTAQERPLLDDSQPSSNESVRRSPAVLAASASPHCRWICGATIQTATRLLPSRTLEGETIQRRVQREDPSRRQSHAFTVISEKFPVMSDFHG